MSSHDVDISILRKINNSNIIYNALLQCYFCIKYESDFFITDKSGCLFIRQFFSCILHDKLSN